MRSVFIVTGAILLTAPPVQAAAVAVVLAVDVSASVTPESYVLQRDGIARAFENPRLEAAIAAAPGGVEVLVLEWSDPDKIKVTVGWTLVTGRRSADGFAAAVRATGRSSRGLTAIGPALAAAAVQLDHVPAPAARRVIDISGDGIADFGPPPAGGRAISLVAAGIAINGLAILTEEPWLEDYYRRNVIGGPGAFVLAARDFSSFADAMLRKLTVEIADAGASSLARRAEPGMQGSPRR